ncbi:MAG: hypothetical protein QW793_06290, partial [Candidatus Caldarchaeum sp.]
INPATNAWNATAGIVAQATAAHSSNSLPTKLEFYTTDSGSASLALRMTITERGFVQIGGSAAGMKLSSYHTITDPSDSNIGALYANADVTFNTYSSQSVYNIILATIRGSASVTGAQYGSLLYAYNYNTATVSVLTGAQAWVRNLSTGTITSAIGLRVANPSNSGTITNNYGLYIENMTAGTNNYGIYIAGSNQYAIYCAGGMIYSDGVVGLGSTPLQQARLYTYYETAATIGNYHALYARVRTISTATSGVQAYNYVAAEAAGTTPPSALYGLVSDIIASPAYTISSASSFQSGGSLGSTTITNYYAFNAVRPTGTITYSYGLYVGSGFAYGIWVTNGYTYLGGPTAIGIGVSSAAYLSLHNTTSISALRFTGSSDVLNPVNGDVWYDSFDIKLRKGGMDHRLDGWVYMVVTPVSVTNTTTETALFSVTIPGGFLAGRRKLLVRAFGRITNASTTATPSLTIRAKYGTSVITVSFSTVSTSSNRAFELEYWISSTTSTSSQRAYLRFLYGGTTSYSSGATATAQTLSDFLNATCVPAVDSSANQTLTVTAQWGAASTSYVCELFSAVVLAY